MKSGQRDKEKEGPRDFYTEGLNTKAASHYANHDTIENRES